MSHRNATSNRPLPPPAGSANNDVGAAAGEQSSVVPTLRVMRLQSPELHLPAASGCLEPGQAVLHNALCLPDSLEVLVGETFTAYLGVLNVSRTVSIRRLSVAAHLQTPSQRWQLPSPLQASAPGGGVDIPPGSAIDAIVSHAIEEAGQHILRVEVSYAAPDGVGTKTFRKFYRFQVVNPLAVRETVVRAGDHACFVSVSVEYNPKKADSGGNAAPIIVSEAEWVPAHAGLVAQRVGRPTPVVVEAKGPQQPLTAAQLLDASGFLSPGSVIRYLFQVNTTDRHGKGIAAGDVLGVARLTWRKSMGETGRIVSPNILCPPLPKALLTATTPKNHNNTTFVVHRSGWSVDVAAAAASLDPRRPAGKGGPPNNLAQQWPITVEPLDPVPSRMVLNQPTPLQFYVVNHSAANDVTCQLQFRSNTGNSDAAQDLAVCGNSFVSLGTLAKQGGSTVVTVRFVALATGLLRLANCWVVDLASDREIAQPPLLHVYVVGKAEHVATTTTTTTNRMDEAATGEGAVVQVQ